MIFYNFQRVLASEKCHRILEMTGGNPLAIRVFSDAFKSQRASDIFDIMYCNQRLQKCMKECIEYAFMSLKEEDRHQLILLSVVETSQFDIKIVKAVLDKDEQESILLMMKTTNQQIVQSICYGQYCLHPLIFEYLRHLPDHEQLTVQAKNNFCQHMIKRIEPNILQADKNYTKAMATVSDNQPLIKLLFRHLSTRKEDSNNLFSSNVNTLLK